MKRILVTGANAAMVRSTLRAFAQDGASLALALRNGPVGREIEAELVAAGAGQVHVLEFEASDPQSCETIVDRAMAAIGGLDAVLVAHGHLDDQSTLEGDPAAMSAALQVNGLSAVTVLMRAAAIFELQGHGCVAAISSGAGERGRRATYGYGMGKALVTTCMQGLRARMQRFGGTAVTVFPCFVDTPMTARLPARMRRVDPALAGRRIHRGMLRGSDFVHVPRWWRIALACARNAPEWLVKRLTAEERFAAKLAAQGDGEQPR